VDTTPTVWSLDLEIAEVHGFQIFPMPLVRPHYTVYYTKSAKAACDFY
jgi:hypothetical protein